MDHNDMNSLNDEVGYTSTQSSDIGSGNRDSLIDQQRSNQEGSDIGDGHAKGVRLPADRSISRVAAIAATKGVQPRFIHPYQPDYDDQSASSPLKHRKTRSYMHPHHRDQYRDIHHFSSIKPKPREARDIDEGYFSISKDDEASDYDQQSAEDSHVDDIPTINVPTASIGRNIKAKRISRIEEARDRMDRILYGMDEPVIQFHNIYDSAEDDIPDQYPEVNSLNAHHSSPSKVSNVTKEDSLFLFMKAQAESKLQRSPDKARSTADNAADDDDDGIVRGRSESNTIKSSRDDPPRLMIKNAMKSLPNSLPFKIPYNLSIRGNGESNNGSKAKTERYELDDRDFAVSRKKDAVARSGPLRDWSSRYGKLKASSPALLQRRRYNPSNVLDKPDSETPETNETSRLDAIEVIEEPLVVIADSEVALDESQASQDTSSPSKATKRSSQSENEAIMPIIPLSMYEDDHHIDAISHSYHPPVRDPRLLSIMMNPHEQSQNLMLSAVLRDSIADSIPAPFTTMEDISFEDEAFNQDEKPEVVEEQSGHDRSYGVDVMANQMPKNTRKANLFVDSSSDSEGNATIKQKWKRSAYPKDASPFTKYLPLSQGNT